MSTNKSALDKMAMEYAQLAPTDYQSGRFTGDFHEAQRARLKSLMLALSNAYDVQEAIKRAENVLKIIDYHSEDDFPSIGDPISGLPF